MKNKRRNYLLLFLPLMSFVLFLSACGINGTATGGNSQSNLTPLQVLQKSESAMKNVKAYHLTLNTTIDTKSSGGTPAATTATPVTIPGSTSIPATSLENAHVTATGTGDVQTAGNEKLNLTTNLGGQSANTSEIIVGNKLYIQSPTDQKWYYIDKNTAENASGSMGSGFTLDQNSLLALIQDAKITDHGTQSLNGQSLRHLTATLDKAGFEKLLSQNPQLKNSYGQLIQQFESNAQTFTTTVDAWIDEQNFYVHRLELGVNAAANTQTSQGSSQSGVPSNISLKWDNTTNLSNFNEAVTITAPANASPFPTSGGSYPGVSATPTVNQ